MAENENKIKYTVNEPDELKNPKFTNTFKVSFSEGEFNIDFGHGTADSENKVKINVVSKVVLPAEKITNLILSLFRATQDYEKTYNKEIFPKADNQETK